MGSPVIWNKTVHSFTQLITTRGRVYADRGKRKPENLEPFLHFALRCEVPSCGRVILLSTCVNLEQVGRQGSEYTYNEYYGLIE